MTTIVAKASGNYSAGGTWTGDAVPGNSDTAQTGAYTVTIDADVTAALLEATSTGHFEITAGGRTVNAAVTHSGTYATNGGLRCTHATGTVTVNGAVTGGSSSAHGIGNGGAGTLTVIGNVTAVGAGYGIRNISTGTLNVGSVGTPTTIQAGTTGYGIANVSTGAVNIVGNITAGSGSNGNGIHNSGNGTVTITGNATGGGGASAHGVHNSSAGTITVSGDSTGGSGAGSIGAYNASTGTITVDRAIGGTNVSATGLHGEDSGGTVTFKRTGSAANGMSAVSGFCKMVVDADYNVIVVKSSTDSDVSMSNDYPAVTDVRDGVLYDRGTLEGTLTELGCPDAADVLDTATPPGTYHAPSVGEVIDTAVFGPSSGTAGTFAVPAEADVRDGTGYGAGGTEFEGQLVASGGAVSISPLRAGLGGG